MAKRTEEALYMISIAARLAGVHPQTLRIYERKKLISPSRSPGSTRLYSEEDIKRLRYIQELTHKLGVNLAGVKMILELREETDRLQDDLEEIRQKFEDVQEEMREEIEKVRKSFRNEITLFPRGKLIPRY
ncbi:MAG TPA: helix-turn-helix transcriptional regulator [Candidatus Subteraquimicrobiales bacterium]